MKSCTTYSSNLSTLLIRFSSFFNIFLSPQITFGQRLHLLSYLFKTIVLRKDIIRSVELIHTLKCNCNCSFCSNEKLSEKIQVMNKKEALKVIDKLHEAGIVAIVFLGGESLVDPNFIDYVKYTRSKRLIPLLQSNGTLLTKSKIKELAKAGLFSVTITLHDTIAKKHDQILNRPNSFKVIEQAIPLLKKHHIKVVLKTIYWRLSIKSGSFKRIVKFAKEHKVLLNINPFMPVGKGVSAKNLLTASEKKYYNKILQDPTITAHTKTRYDSQCPAGHSYLGILPDGEIIPCYFLPVSVGNIKDISIDEARRKSKEMGLFKKGRKECIMAMNRKFFFEVIQPLYSGKHELPVRYDKDPVMLKKFRKFGKNS